MPSLPTLEDREPTREEIDATPGSLAIEFGSVECPLCQAIQPTMATETAAHPGVRHLKIEDGRGRLLGRSFRVKLWPTLVFLRDGKVLQQLVRPSSEEIEKAFDELEPRSL
jgi:thioredoxin 1